ncbi:MAG: SPOR domain-containing protein [Proteobacteria bacterium]|nr:SPOR domain-containing protein [Pseudomonadota bacterium]
MPRDYKTRANGNDKKSLPGYVWLLSGLAIGLFIAFIIYLDKQPESGQDFGSAVQQELAKLKQKANNKKPEKTKSPAATKSKEKKEPKFNFYTILPELEVLIPESETRPPETKNNTVTNSKNTAGANKQYVLQVGSFQNLNDAEKLKANLAFFGLEANIQHVTVNKQAWHRVRTGPYRDKQQLYKNQKLLKNNNINAISMELK